MVSTMRSYESGLQESRGIPSVIVISYNFVTMFGYSQTGHLYLLLCGYLYYAYISDQHTC